MRNVVAWGGIARCQREDFLYTYHTDLPEADFQLAYHAYEWPKKMMSVIKESTDKANAEHREFEDSLKRRRTGFSKQLTEYQAEITAFETIGEKDLKVEGKDLKDASNRDKFAQQTLDLSQKLKDAQVEADEINYQEGLFGWPKTKFNHVGQMTTALDPFLTLWTIVSNFSTNYTKWMSGPFANLDPEKIEGDVGDMFRKIYKLTKVFAGAGGSQELPEPLKVAEATKEKIDKFQKYQPLITAICNPGLRDRHWAAMSEAVGFELKRDDHTSLDRLLGRRVEEKMTQLQELSDVASREFSFEKMLDKMTADWEGLAFELGAWKATGTYILKGGPVDEAQTLLDDHIVKSQAMTASPFAKPFEARLVPWERRLVRFQDILDQWLKCQGKWIYLEPIFSAEEIMKQIPTEGAAFKSMDATWHAIMDKVVADPNMLVVADVDNLLEDLQAANASLDVVEKGLNDFLDTKKMSFPRFYFLSNDELLEILSEAKDPMKIQPFVRKIFEAMKELQFEDGNMMTAMFSVEGEKVEWNAGVDPHQSNAVEVWLGEVEEAMMQALRKQAGLAVDAYAGTDRNKWILEWPGQLVLGCSQIYWTKECGDALETEGSTGLQKYGAKCTQQVFALSLLSSALCVAAFEIVSHGGCVRAWVLRVTASAQRHREPGARRPDQAGAVHAGRAGDHRRARARRDGVHGRRRRQLHHGLQVALPAALLYGGQRHRGEDDQRHRVLRLRVLGQQRPPGDHAADGPLLHDHHAGADLPPRLLARRPGRNGQDGDGEGPVESHRHPVRGVQLLGRAGLQGDGQVFQGAGQLGCVGVLRRVQPHRAGGAVRGGAAGAHHPARTGGQGGALHVRGRGHSAAPNGQRLHYHEPGVRRALGAARQPQGVVPRRGHDGAGLRTHRRDHAVLVRLPGRASHGAQARDDVPPVLRAAVQPGTKTLGVSFSSHS